jgi:hypothetical protein
MLLSNTCGEAQNMISRIVAYFVLQKLMGIAQQRKTIRLIAVFGSYIMTRKDQLNDLDIFLSSKKFYNDNRYFKRNFPSVHVHRYEHCGSYPHSIVFKRGKV